MVIVAVARSSGSVLVIVYSDGVALSNVMPSALGYLFVKQFKEFKLQFKLLWII